MRGYLKGTLSCLLEATIKNVLEKPSVLVHLDHAAILLIVVTDMTVFL